MTNVQEFINLLKNGNANERYEACLQLMKLSPIPTEALEAIQAATKDEDTAVSSAAKKIINLHNIESSSSNIEAEEVDMDPTQKAVQDALKTHKSISTYYVFLTALILIMNCFWLIWAVAVVGWEEVISFFLGPVLIVGGSILFSRIFIKLSYTKIGYFILFSAPIWVWLYLVRDTW